MAPSVRPDRDGAKREQRAWRIQGAAGRKRKRAAASAARTLL